MTVFDGPSLKADISKSSWSFSGGISALERYARKLQYMKTFQKTGVKTGTVVKYSGLTSQDRFL